MRLLYHLLLVLILCSLAISFSVFAEGTTVKVSFDLNGVPGEAPETVRIKRGETLTLPERPTSDGQTFAGWYMSPNGDQYEAFDPSEAITEDLTLYAQWIEDDHVRYLTTTDGDKTVTLGYSNYSGVEIRRMSDDSLVSSDELERGEVDYPVYKDLNRNGKLDDYEDWRQDIETRTRDLAAQMSYREIAGLMLYSSHQRSWNSPVPTDAQVAFLANDDLRAVLIAGEVPAEIAAPWNNNIQAITERLGLGIPANNSSDPRHSAAVGVEYYSANTGTISLWPNSLGLAATFDPDLVFDFGKIASTEYRALGITTALSPQIDIATEPRWNRVNGTFGEDPRLAADMTKAYVQGFQGTFDKEDNLLGWGADSVNTMIKHWPGGGGGEGGRDAHNDYGKYSVYPGNNFDAHLVPFVDGALVGTAEETTMATAVMPYYTISYNVDPSGKDLANAFSEYIITTLLRDEYGFDGVICTDWGVDSSRGWGPDIETLDTAGRSKLLIEAGVDQFGGQNTSRYILEAVELAREEGTEEQFRQKMEESAARLLKNIFRAQLFENPYLDEVQSSAVVASDEFVEQGYQAQIRSIVMLKNEKDLLPLDNTTSVYVPSNEQGEYLFKGVDNHFNLVDDPEQADVALVTLNTPTSPMDPIIPFFGGGWLEDIGYFPLTLQYSEYTAVRAREVSIAGDYRNITDSSPSYLNRSYRNTKMTATNFQNYQVLLDVKEAMGHKPVIAVINVDNPLVMGEVEPLADALLLRFAASDNAVLEIITGSHEPSGLLPIQFPKDMASVEAQFEDTPRDMEVYVDSEGHSYDFAYGLNWDGIIDDDRVAKYNVPPVTQPTSGGTTHNYPTVLTHTLPVGKIGNPYHAQVEVKESNAKVELVSGTLPLGIALDNGVLSGTPTESTHEYGDQLIFKISAPGKQSRLFRITLLVNEIGEVELADPNELSITLTIARSKQESNYTAASWQEFNKIKEYAEAVYAQAKHLTQSQVDQATNKLKTAMDTLERK